MNALSGQLFIVATPIGHLDDISQRAIDTLRTVDTILCEDTRVSKKLMNRYGITVSLESLHQHNEKEKCQQVVKKMAQGKCYALISDAGLPVINDPGQQLVSVALAAGLTVIPIPGANAAVTALACSGFDASQFVFAGFLPSLTTARKKRLCALKEEAQTLIFYEAPHRMLSMLNDMIEIFGADRNACLAKELTKIHETIITGTLEELLLWINQDSRRQKGEFVIIVAGNNQPQTMREQEMERWLSVLLTEVSPSTAASIVAKVTGISKSRLYQQALKVKGK